MTQHLQQMAPAKVNLFLHVGPVQANGRHPLDSLVVFAGAQAADRLIVTASDDLGMTITVTDSTITDHIGPDEDNLVLRAARVLQAETGIRAGAMFTLEKRLPVAAGIGGGSADAAAALGHEIDDLTADRVLVQRAAAHELEALVQGSGTPEE